LEQILLYIVTISGFSGFMLGLYSLLMPVLQRRGLRAPFSKPRDWDGDEEALDEDARHFAATSFNARRSALLERLPGERATPAIDDIVEEDDEDLLGNLDLSKEAAEVAIETLDGDDDAPLEPDAFTADATSHGDDEYDADEADVEEGNVEDDGEDDEAEDEEYEEDGEDGEPERPIVQVVSAGGAGDMLALFGEGSDHVKEVEAWRVDLPNPTLEELLAEARNVRGLLQSKGPSS
jgi:hypothetical protein